MNTNKIDTRLYDASMHWSDAQWARFLQVDIKEMPSIRKYMAGDQRFMSGIFIEKNKDKYDWWFHFAFYCYSTKQPFATYDEALEFSKRFLLKFDFNKTQQKLLDIPRYAAMLIKIYGGR
jgi:hypothetical protein